MLDYMQHFLLATNGSLLNFNFMWASGGFHLSWRGTRGAHPQNS